MHIFEKSDFKLFINDNKMENKVIFQGCKNRKAVFHHKISRTMHVSSNYPNLSSFYLLSYLLNDNFVILYRQTKLSLNYPSY